MHNDTFDGGKAIWSENGEIHFGKEAPRLKIKDEVDPKRGEKHRYIPNQVSK